MTAKTVITTEEKDFNSPIQYTFKNEEGVIEILANNTAEARRKLNKLTGNKLGYILVQRLL